LEHSLFSGRAPFVQLGYTIAAFSQEKTTFMNRA